MRSSVVLLAAACALFAGCTGDRTDVGSAGEGPTQQSVSPAAPSSVASTVTPALPVPRPRTLASLGDSFASGVGARGMTQPCGRSEGGWTGLLAEELGMNFVNLACSGATLEETIAQVDDLPENVDVVAVTTGGNSLKFAQVVIRCLADDCESGWTSALANLPGIRPAALELLTEVHALRPGVSAIVLTLYPTPTRTGLSCGKITEEVADLFTKGPALLNTELVAAASEARSLGVPVVVVDPVEFLEHPLCSDDPWFHGPEKGLFVMHLNDAGYAALATAARAELVSGTG